MAATNGPNGLQTLVDLELAGVDGPTVALQADSRRQAYAKLSGARTQTDDQLVEALSLQWCDLKERHESYDAKFWTECRALYASGKRLFADKEVMARLFPKNPYEDQDVYLERVKRAHYFPYAGTILDHLISGLSTDPLTVSFAEVADDGKQTIPKDAAWWANWIADVTGNAMELDDGEGDDAKADDTNDEEGGCSAHQFSLDVVREAMQVQTAWLLCSLPGVADGDLDEDAAGSVGAAADADPRYRIIPAEEVIDWQEDKQRGLEWVLTRSERRVRSTLRSRRKQIEQTYTLWTRTDWVRYVVVFDPAQPPQDNDVIKPTDHGDHPFKRVPFVRFTLPDGLYGMGKMHSLAREHLNKRCAMSWAEYKSLYPILYEFQGSEEANGMPVPSAQQDPGRGTNQVRAIGYSQIRGKDDRAEFVGPPDGPFKSARESCGDTMREMHRVMFSMALSANQDSAALMRSGDSKDADYASTEVLLGALGIMVRWFVRQMIAMAAIGRGEKAPSYQVSGLESFDTQGITEALNDIVTLFSGVPIKSALFAEKALSEFYSKYLGDGASQEEREEMRDQVRDSLLAEQIAAEAMMMGDGGDTSGKPADPNDDEGGGPAAMPAVTKPKPKPGGIKFDSSAKPKP